ncbi:M55 family metallopeptidase [Paenibacillus senegalensis]|uniref:M55 family metallopeptidase n=1 Tax=Paenibacillus senegalensis TaxID=1465766 RepID=UPI000289AEC1|nr:M55 family metallopeptidase [Paenibacillus senegalensis]
MNIYVSVDMEGIAGVVLREQLSKGEALYNEARHLLTAEVNAVVEALVEQGAKKIIIKDAHGSGFNFIPELLHPGAVYCMGATPVARRFPGLDSGFDGAILLGYHAMAGTGQAVRDHTMSSLSYRNIELNGKPVGEITLDALLFGLHNVPVLLVTGDDATCREAKQCLGEVTTYATKEALNRHAALIKSPKLVREELKQSIGTALSQRPQCKPLKLEGPYELMVDLMTTDLADSRKVDGTHSIRLDGCRILYKDQDLLSLLSRGL